VILAALLVAFFVAANLFTDFMWFDQLGFESVLITQWTARVVMFVVGFLAMALPVWEPSSSLTASGPCMRA